MEKIRTFTLIAFASTLCFVNACDKDSVVWRVSPPSAMHGADKNVDASFINLSVIKTFGNHSYIPMNLYDCKEGCVAAILIVLSEFEKAHPELDITSWSISDHPYLPTGVFDIYGLWVNHRPRK